MENKNSVSGGAERTANGGPDFEQYKTPENAENLAETPQEGYEGANLMGQRALENIDSQKMGVVIDEKTEEKLNPNMIGGQLVGTDLPKNAGDGEKMNEKWAEAVEEVERDTDKDPGAFLRGIAELRWKYLDTQFGREKGDGLNGEGKVA